MVEEWSLDIKLHREDVPALEQKNVKNWFLNDLDTLKVNTKLK
jgi:hypothetical protein